MDLGKPGDVDRTDAIGAAKKEEFWQSAAQKTSKTEVATLLKRFQENPEEVRQVVRLEISWYNEAAAEIFALVVFVSDCCKSKTPRSPLLQPGTSILPEAFLLNFKWCCATGW